MNNGIQGASSVPADAHGVPAIPAGARVVVRTAIGVDPADGRMKFRDFVGHVRAWDGTVLELTRDAAANGSRPAEDVRIDAHTIVRLKPVPERHYRS